MDKPDGPPRHLEYEKSEMDIDFLDKGHLLDLDGNEVREEEDAEYVELERINGARWENKNGLGKVLQEDRLQVLCQYHYTQAAGH